MQILITLLILNLLVIAHEFGHYSLARLFGVRVLEFSVGFGHVLAKTVRGGIQYSLRAVPLGGFVKMAGMDMALEGEAAPEAADDPGSLRRQPVWKKILIILAGPVYNLILAGLVFAFMLTVIGIPDKFDPRPIIGKITTRTPAYEAGLARGDRVLAIDGRPVGRWQELTGIIQETKGKPLVLTLQRSGKSLTRTVKPMYDPDSKRYFLGIEQVITQYKRLPLLTGIGVGFKTVYIYSAAILDYLGKAIVGKARMDFMGPIGMTQEVGQSVAAGSWRLLYLIGIFNVFLALFNLLPIPLPLLDGGWVVIYLIEAIRRKEFTDEQNAGAQFFGLLIMLGFFLFVSYGDIATFIRHSLSR